VQLLVQRPVSPGRLTPEGGEPSREAEPGQDVHDPFWAHRADELVLEISLTNREPVRGQVGRVLEAVGRDLKRPNEDLSLTRVAHPDDANGRRTRANRLQMPPDVGDTAHVDELVAVDSRRQTVRGCDGSNRGHITGPLEKDDRTDAMRAAGRHGQTFARPLTRRHQQFLSCGRVVVMALLMRQRGCTAHHTEADAGGDHRHSDDTGEGQPGRPLGLDGP